MAWRAAYSLQTLKSQLDSAYPGWKFLGFLGDQAHASQASDHNINPAGVVCALDIGPGGGLDIHALARRLVANPHPDLKYIISNRRIANWQTGFKWERYSGKDPHDTHIHISVGRGKDGQSTQPYDDTTKWNIGGEDMAVMNDEDAKQLFITTYHTNPQPGQYAGWVGKYTRDQARAERDTAPWKVQNHAITYYDQVVSQRDAALKQLAEAQTGGKIDPAKLNAVKKEAAELDQAIKKLEE